MIRPASGPGFLDRGFGFLLFGFPVTIKHAFWLVTLVLASRRLQWPAAFVEWVLVVFVAVLIHELGHALAGRRFGLEPVIVLHGMGGLTRFMRGADRLTWQQDVILSVAGPGAGFVSGALVWGLAQIAPLPFLLRLAASDFFMVSAVWGAFNLVPMLPLDGGNVLAVVLRRMGRDWRDAYRVSVATAAVLVIVAISLGEPWLALLAALFGVQNWQALKGVSVRYW